jgi:hypothetical protein
VGRCHRLDVCAMIGGEGQAGWSIRDGRAFLRPKILEFVRSRAVGDFLREGLGSILGEGPGQHAIMAPSRAHTPRRHPDDVVAMS